MPEPVKPGNDGESVETVEKLREQIENLNKGIAASRDEARSAKDEAKAIKDQFDAFKKEIEGASEEDLEQLDLDENDVKKLEVWAKKMGLVKKEDLEAERQKLFNESLQNIEAQAIDEFIKAHPEFEKDEEWAKVKAEFALYKQPTNITQYRQLLKKIYKELSGEDEKEQGRAEARADLQKRKILGAGGRGPSDSSTATAESLRAKYPNLSKEQIDARLAEIESLYPTKT